MSLTTSEMTPADIAAVTCNNGSNGAWGGDGLVLFYLHEARQHVAVFAPDGERRMSGPYRDVFPDLYVGREGEVLIVPSAARFLELVRRHPDVVPGAPVSEDGNHVVLRCRLR